MMKRRKLSEKANSIKFFRARAIAFPKASILISGGQVGRSLQF